MGTIIGIVRGHNKWASISGVINLIIKRLTKFSGHKTVMTAEFVEGAL